MTHEKNSRLNKGNRRISNRRLQNAEVKRAGPLLLHSAIDIRYSAVPLGFNKHSWQELQVRIKAASKTGCKLQVAG